MKKRDFILIGAIIAVILVVWGIFLFIPTEEGSYVIVKKDNEEIARYSLSRDGEYELNGGTNILKIENGEARMIYGNCPKIKGDCTTASPISKRNQRIECRHNHLMVIVDGNSNTPEDEVEIVLG